MSNIVDQTRIAIEKAANRYAFGELPKKHNEIQLANMPLTIAERAFIAGAELASTIYRKAIEFESKENASLKEKLSEYENSVCIENLEV